MKIIVDGRTTLNTDNLKKLSEGQDGELYVNGDEVIKICSSDYMTYEKLEDFNSIKNDSSVTHIILPEKKVEKTNTFVKRLVVTPLFGYTQEYKVEKKTGISKLSTIKFIEQMELLRSNIHKLFSANEIAITDTNPQNLLVNENDEIFLIDHDRCITPSCMEIEKYIIAGDYFNHNERRFGKLLNRTLIMEALKGYKITRQIVSLATEEEIKNYPREVIYSMLSDYDTMEKYGSAKAKELHLK